MAEAQKDHGRQDFRVDDMIPISDVKMTQEAFEINKTKVGIKSRQSSMLQDMVGRDVFAGEGHEGMNPDVANMLESLDAKLNYLIGVNVLNDANQSDLEERAVNLSVTGVSFITSNQYAPGDHTMVTLMLPSFPPSTLELLGTVRRVESRDGSRLWIGVQFHYRCDEEEDSISKYVYRRHRETIRSRSRNRDG